MLLELARREHLDFICLQETMVSDDRSQEKLGEKWNGPSYWSPAIGHQGGVAILISPW